MRCQNQLLLTSLSPRQRSYLLKKKQKQNSPSVSSQEKGFFRSLKDSIQITKLVGSIKIYAEDWSNSLRTYLRKSLQDLCSLCRLDTVKAHWHQLRSQLGTSVEILNMSLLVALTRARSLWGSAVKYVNSYVNRPIKLPSLPDSTQTRSLLKRGLLLMVGVLLLPVLAVVLLVRVLISLSLTIR